MSERTAAMKFGPSASCGAFDMGWTNAKVAVECHTLNVGKITIPATSYGIFRTADGYMVRRGPDVVYECASDNDAWAWLETQP